MKKSKEELLQEAELERKNKLMEALFDEMLSQYAPAVDGEADYEPTSVELAHKLSETIDIAPGVLALALKERGYHVKLRGTVFRWLMKSK